MNKHKVLFFSYWYPNRSSLVFPVFTRKHAQAISTTCDLTVLSLTILKSDAFYKKEVEVITDKEGVETHQIYLYSRFSKLLYMFLPLHYTVVRSYFNQHLAKKKFTILHSNILFPCAIIGNRLATEMRLKHVITEHWSRLPEFFSSNFYKRSGKKAYDQADAITCVSEVLYKRLLPFTSNKHVVVVPNVVDSKDFQFKPHRGEIIRFVAAANWTGPKNPFVFVEALKRLAESGTFPPFELCLAGNGDQLETIRSQVYPFKIHFPGILNAEELNRELNSAHYFLHGSNFETFSTIIVEALMCGLPSVVSRVGIAEEVITPQNGLIAENTVEDFEAKIKQMCSSHYDREQIARSIQNRYSSQSVAEKMVQVYNAL